MRGREQRVLVVWKIVKAYNEQLDKKPEPMEVIVKAKEKLSVKEKTIEDYIESMKKGGIKLPGKVICLSGRYGLRAYKKNET